MTIRKYANIRWNGTNTTWKDLSVRYNIDQALIYNRAIKSGKSSMKIEDDIISWEIQEWMQYFIVEGKQMENVRELARYCKVHVSTVFNQMQRNPVNFNCNGLSIKRIKKMKLSIKATEPSEAHSFISEPKPLFKYDVIEFGGQQLVRKIYIGGVAETLSHTYGYDEGKQFLTV
jgi:hypothetical protein